MTLESDAGVIAVPAKLHSHDHDHSHDLAPDAGQADDAARAAPRFSPFLASALDRLGLAVILAGCVWIGVFWAVR